MKGIPEQQQQQKNIKKELHDPGIKKENKT